VGLTRDEALSKFSAQILPIPGHGVLVPVALALEVRPVNGRNSFEPREFGFQRLEADLDLGGHRPVIVR
jgi:hypothetical protein